MKKVIFQIAAAAFMLMAALTSCDDDKPKTLVSIAVTTQPAKVAYVVNEPFDPAGMVVTATFSDQSTEQVTVTAAMLEYDFSTAGSKTVTVAYTYEDVTKTASVTVTVNEKTVSVGAQVGTLEAGEAGTVTFPVTTAHIASGEYAATVANLPAGVTVQGGNVTIANNAGTLTLAGDDATVEGAIATLTLTIDGATSAAFTLTVAPAPILPGSEGDPFIVNSAATLQKVGTGADGWTLTAHYRQTANIDFAEVENWTAVGTFTGTYVGPFTGTYDGGGYSISNLAGTQGLFEVIGTGGSVRNVALINANINSVGIVVGGIAGSNGGTIENCYVTGSITGRNDVGGVVGRNTGIIKNCYTTCNVTSTRTGDSHAGGILGQIYSGRIVNCFATGIIRGDRMLGGIMGRSDNMGSSDGGGVVEYCVALNVEIRGVNFMGKIAGLNHGGSASNNYHRAEGMTLVGVSQATSVNGESVSAADTHGANSGTWWSDTVEFSADLWDFAANRLPHLKTTTGAAFNQAQNPTVE